jgi:HK97 family phage major capsid protein
VNLETIQARIGEIDAELAELRTLEDDDDGDFTEDDQTRFDDLATEFDDLDEKRQRLMARNERLARVRAAVADPTDSMRTEAVPDGHTPTEDAFSEGVRGVTGRDPFNYDELRSANPAEMQARALSAIEQAPAYSTRDREVLTGWVEDYSPDDLAESDEARSLVRHIVATSAPEYLRSWIRAFKTGVRNGTPDPDAIRFLTRAMSLTDAAGGYAVPQQLDPALILTSDGSTNPIRQISRHVIATGDTWTGLSTTHAAWSNDAEAAEVSDDATTFAQPSIPVHKAQVFVPFSIEIGMDYPGFQQDLRTAIAGGKDDLDATNFATGSGSDQPTGIVTALVAGAANVITSATTDVFAIADVYATEEALPPMYLARAQWAANKPIYNDVRQFDTSGGAGMWERIGAAQPSELLGYPAQYASAMDGSHGTGDNYVLILGDWSNYVIADRVGMTLELVPHLFATGANRPSGQRGLYGFARTGADSVNDNGFALLNVT